MTLTRSFALLPLLLTVIWLAACAPHVALPGPAVIAPAVSGDFVLASDGAELPLRRWLPDREKPDAIVLALHGFNDYGQFIDDAARTWAAQGIAVYAPDQRGFGETANRGLWPGVDALADDVRTIARLLRQRHPGIPLYLLGESMGAAVAVVALAGQDPPPVAGVILSAPAVWTRTAMPGYQRAALFIAAHTVPWLRLTGQGLRIMASDNIEALRKLSRDPLVIKGTRVDAIWGLAELMDRAHQAAAHLRTPALILYGANDQVIPPDPVRDFIANLPMDAHEHQRFAFYPSGYHLLMRDLEAGQVIADIQAWITSPTSGLPSGADREARERVADAPRPRPTG